MYTQGSANRQSSRGHQREARLSLFPPPPLQVPASLKDQSLALASQGREGCREKVTLQVPAMLCLCLPLALSSAPYQDPLPLGQVGEARRPCRIQSGLSSLLSASGTVTAPRFLGPRVGTDPTTEIWPFKSERYINPVKEEYSDCLENNSSDDKQGPGTHGLRLWGDVRA